MKTQSRQLSVLGLTFLLFASACAAPSAPTPTPTPSPLDLAKAFGDADHQRDIEGVMALFTDDIQWNFAFNVQGRKLVRNVLEYSYGLNDQRTYSDCALAVGVVTCQVVQHGDCQPAGVDGEIRFEFTGEKISKINGSYFDDITVIGAKAFPWARENLPQDFAKNRDEEWAQFGGNGEPAGKLTPRELGQLIGMFCTKYVEATK